MVILFRFCTAHQIFFYNLKIDFVVNLSIFKILAAITFYNALE